MARDWMPSFAMPRLRSAALLVLLVACRGESGASSTSGPAASGSARWWPSEEDGPPAFTAGVGAHFSVMWAGFPEYPGVRPLCSHTTRPLPHNFTRVFVTSDAPPKVAAFYTADAGAGTQVETTAQGVVITGPPDKHRRLETRPVTAGLPPGCTPQPGEMTIIVVMESPPYPH